MILDLLFGYKTAISVANRYRMESGIKPNSTAYL